MAATAAAWTISGSAGALYQPIWAEDVADCVSLGWTGAGAEGCDLAGPEALSYDETSVRHG